MFRSGPRELKVFYPTSDPKNKTVLIHREYPTSFRYKKTEMVLDEKEGGRGHYDLVVLNPDFVNAHRIEEVMAQNYKKSRRETPYHLLAAIEFKLITRPLGKNLVEEIHRDFQKLSWALEKKQTKQAYMIIFNRAREEKRFWEELLPEMAKQNPRVKGIYIESIIKKKKNYNIVYLNNWKSKLRYSR
jgi:hypothetical protein